jgi:hypothetical protein
MTDPLLCLRCNKVVEGAWQICPYCEAVLKGDARGSRGGSAHDLLVWAETHLNREGWVLVVTLIGGCLALFGAITVVGLVGEAVLGKGGVGIVLVVVALGLTGVVFGLTRDSYAGRFFRMGILFALFLVGSLALLSCLVGIVIFVFFVRMP